MANSCNGGVGCCIMNSLIDTLGNLFSTAPYCGCGNGNGTCGCGNGNNAGTGSCPYNTGFANGFVSGVNAANASGGNNGISPISTIGNSTGTCGCGNGNNGSCGCGGTGNLSSYTGCGNQCYDAYYARQYGLYPFNQGTTCGCN